MKRFFKFALVALATAAVAVACQKPEQQPEKIALKGISLNKPAVELAIGAKETLTVKFDPENVTEKPTIEWSTSAPAVATVAEGEVTAVAAGEATITAKAGSFTATCKVTVKGEEQPKPGDFTSPDWANIGAITNGNHTFKFTKDDKFAYFYTERPKDDRFGELWGDGVGYVYYAFDFDGDLTTGEELLGNGKYEYIAYIYCFGGSADAPEIKITAEGGVAPSTYSIANVIAKGTVDANGLKLEYAVPLSDLPQLPENFTIYTWGNKSLSKVEYKYPYEEPQYEHDYTPSAEYLAETNLWKAVDAAGSDFFIINCINGEWPKSAEASVDGVYALTHEQSTYKMHYDVASNGDWERQLFLFPKAENAIAIQEGEKYNLKVTFYANKDLPRVFMKIVNYQADKDNKEGAPLLFGDEIKSVKAGEPTVFEYKDVAGAANTENLTFVIDFGGAPADVDIYVKDIIIEHVGAPVPDTWDYTPSDKYLAVTNLWKPADGLDAVNWTLGEGLTKPEVSFSQSTYTFTLAEESNDIQSTQFRVVSNNITLDPAKKYNFYCKVYSSAGTKLWLKAHPDPNTHWPELFETAGYDVAGDRMVIEAGETKEIALENIEASLYPEIITKQCIMFDLSPHAANNLIHIKDIIVEEVGGETPVELGPFDSNVEWAASTDDKAYTDCVLNVTYDGATYEDVANVKIGTSSKVGKFTLTIPAGTTYVTYWAIGWNGKDGVYKITAGDNVIDGKAAANTGAAGTGPYNVTITDADKYVINLGGALPADLPVTIESTSDGYRAFFFGIQAHTGDAPAPAPTGIKIDGDFSDWAGIEAFASEATSRIREWKISSDDDNVYVYVAMRKNRAESSKKLVIGFNTDNDAATGSLTDNNNMKGCEAIARNIIPFISSTEGITGADSGSEVVSTAGATETGVVVVNAVPGTEDASSDSANCYLELSIPKAKLALPATAISAGCSYDYYFTGYKSVTL